MHNIEKSAFRKGEYVGYAKGVWHIKRIPKLRAVSRFGNWVARHRDNPQMPTLRAYTLTELSTMLEQHAGE